MVVPMPMSQAGGSINQLSPELREKLNTVKYTVLALWVLGVLRTILNPMSGLSTLILAILGTFLMSEDPQLANCYAMLRDSFLGQCCGSGGLAMLMPFLVFDGVSAVMDFMQVLTFVTFGGMQILLNPLVLLTFLVLVAETVGTVCTYQVFKETMPSPSQGQQSGAPPGYRPLSGGGQPTGGAPGQGGGGGGMGSFFGGAGAPSGGGPGRPAGGSGPSAVQGPAPPQSFQMFSGQGNRLGG